MQQASVQVQYVNQPKNPQWSNGSIKDTSGIYYSVPKEYLAVFAPGRPANITFETKQGNKGPYNVVTSINGMPVGQPQQAGQASNWQAPQQQQTPARTAPPTAKDKQIWVQGIVQAMLQSQRYGNEELNDLINIAQQGWRHYQSPSLPTSENPAEGMGDDFPGSY